MSNNVREAEINNVRLKYFNTEANPKYCGRCGQAGQMREDDGKLAHIDRSGVANFQLENRLSRGAVKYFFERTLVEKMRELHVSEHRVPEFPPLCP